MTPIQVETAPKSMERDEFISQARKGVSKVSNLCGWSKETREEAMFSIVFDEAAETEWQRLLSDTQDGKPLPIWEWNGYVRSVVDQVVQSVYSLG